MIDASRFDVLTFDCYGTLVDWESGILAALAPLLAARGLRPERERLLALYAEGEARAEAGGWRPYRDVLVETQAHVLGALGTSCAPGEEGALADSLPHWTPFPDTLAALDRLRRRLRVGVVSNIDDALFARTREHLGDRIDFVVTAQAAGAYKPDPAPFEAARRLMAERWGTPPERHLHAGQSRFHDVAPARALGMASVLVTRRGDGATRPVDAEPDAAVPDLAALADLLVGPAS